MKSEEKVLCPLCNDTVNKLLYRYHIDGEKKVIEKIKAEHPLWAEQDGACSRCVDYYHTAVVQQQLLLPAVGPFFPVKSLDDFIVLPTGLRVNAHPGYTGKGVTICFIDSGFCRHPDLTFYRNRIKAVVDVTDSEYNPVNRNDSQWHGTMTSVVCSGDGFLSNGLYKGIASDAELVLVKVQDDEQGILPANINKGLQWVLDNQEKYNIRIVNISLGDGRAGSYKNNEIDILAEKLVAGGVVIVAACGNDERVKIQAPANAPNVIAVGGINDGNTLDTGGIKAYHSSYGATDDSFMKPELVAHAMWIAAPILPGTIEATEAAALQSLINAPANALVTGLNEYIGKTKLDMALLAETGITEIRQAVTTRIREAKYISDGYMHVDGTSFAAPIVTAVVAQLLEANPALQPAAIRQILFSTAKRVDSIIPERQGFGMMQPRKALLKAMQQTAIVQQHPSPFINREKNVVVFYMHNYNAAQISVAGSFNGWEKDILFLEPGSNGIWKIEIPMPEQGRYQYKFFLDGKYWMEDVENPYRLPDGFNGFNSLLIIEN
jgi:serine protease AprX